MKLLSNVLVAWFVISTTISILAAGIACWGVCRLVGLLGASTGTE